jgi:hypothetical protein
VQIARFTQPCLVKIAGFAPAGNPVAVLSRAGAVFLEDSHRGGVQGDRGHGFLGLRRGLVSSQPCWTIWLRTSMLAASRLMSIQRSPLWVQTSAGGRFSEGSSTHWSALNVISSWRIASYECLAQGRADPLPRGRAPTGRW